MKKLTMMRSALGVAVVLANQATFAEKTVNINDPQIEEVVVTGLKIDRNLQDTPVSVALTTAQDIEERALVDIYDVLNQTANVTGEFGSSFTIRGIDAFSVSTNGYGGNHTGLASVYVDGAPMPYRVVQQGAFSTWDVNQIEVLRGPQSTLQGRNSLAGAIVVSTQKPTYEWGGDVKVQMGENGQRDLAFAGGGAIVEDQLAFRVSVEDREYDGINHTPYLSKNGDYSENQNYRAKLLFEPEAIEGLSALLSYTKTKNDIGVPFVRTPVDGSSVLSASRVLDHNTQTSEDTNTDLYNLRVDYDIDEHWSFTSISSYTDARYGYLWDGDASSDLDLELDNKHDAKTTTQEFRLVYNDDTISAVAGLYWSRLKSEDDTIGQRGIDLEDQGLIGVAQGMGFTEAQARMVLGYYGALGADPIVLNMNRAYTEQEIETYAVFADVEYKLTEQLDLLLGFRWDYEEQERNSVSNNTIDTVLPDPVAAAMIDPLLGFGVTAVNGFITDLVNSSSTVEPESDADFREFLPKAGLVYHWNDDISTSFIYQEGYRSGGISYNIARGVSVAYDAEYTKNYELSFRSQWLDDRLTWNANAFFIDWTDQQLTEQLSPARYDEQTGNVGKSEVTGMETEISYQVNGDLLIYGGLGYSKTEFKDYTNRSGNFDGREFAESPEWTANAGLTYFDADGWFANVNASYVDDAVAFLYPNGSNNLEPASDRRVVVDLRAGYEWRSDVDWGVYVSVKNLLDEEYVVTPAKQNNRSVTLGTPRQASVELRVSF